MTNNYSMADLKERLEEEYMRAVKLSRNFTVFDELAEFCLSMLHYDNIGTEYINKVEEELLERKLLKEKIKTWDDFINNRKRITSFDSMLFYILRSRGFTHKGTVPL